MWFSLGQLPPYHSIFLYVRLVSEGQAGCRRWPISMFTRSVPLVGGGLAFRVASWAPQVSLEYLRHRGAPFRGSAFPDYSNSDFC